MTGTSSEVFGPRNQTGSEPCPARKMPLLSEVQIGSSRVLNCSFRSPDHFDISIHGSTMKIEDTRAIIEGAVDSCDAFQPLFSSGSHKFQYFLMNLFLYV